MAILSLSLMFPCRNDKRLSIRSHHSPDKSSRSRPTAWHKIISRQHIPNPSCVYHVTLICHSKYAAQELGRSRGSDFERRNE